jgi:hypothetical protein
MTFSDGYVYDVTINTTPEELFNAVTRALTRSPPDNETERFIHNFIQRWPYYTGGWLLLHCGLLRNKKAEMKCKTATLTIHTDHHASVMNIWVEGIKLEDLPGFNDFFIRRQQFIWFEFTDEQPNQHAPE